ncbi:protein of unknown function [uncultured Woeseiaceae bacterium]|uniref:Uncharacterized protein n=1 Tax=uncultured Woeseiaceae bacterium TaxID=1983305 RepID=A0A7D9H5B8_9GAMM|nr:protein of unknown function [uncultured Woeseiaceae bacterium]
MVIGNIFGEMISKVSTSVARKNLGVCQESSSQAFYTHVISVFDTTYVDVAEVHSTFEEAAEFLLDLIRLAQIKLNLFFIFKPSKCDEFFVGRNQIWASPLKGKKIVDLRIELSQLPNVLVLGDSSDPVEVIAAADVVITACFSSTTADALSAGKAAFWYEAGDNTRGYPADRVKGLVAHGYDELETYLEDALMPGHWERISEQRSLRKFTDPYLDGLALSRLRNSISSSGNSIMESFSPEYSEHVDPLES